MTPPTGSGICDVVGLPFGRIAALIETFAARGWTIATAESLTAGLLSATLTEVPGSSAVVRGGIVCYATDLKASLVGVDEGLLARVGPVDPQVAAQLARGARQRCGASVGVGLTGVAGPAPQGGRAAGTVYVAVATAERDDVAPAPTAPDADRQTVRAAAVRRAVQMLERLVSDGGPR